MQKVAFSFLPSALNLLLGNKTRLSRLVGATAFVPIDILAVTFEKSCVETEEGWDVFKCLCRAKVGWLGKGE